jgi:hypothetical protein
MSISYSGLTNYGKATNPSVEMGLGSMNILRDPPRSITTRRVDKVGQTSSITEMIDDSGNRACEAINLYARGVNPSVSVSYGNAGNNGGQRSSSVFGSNITGGLQAKLPYTIMKDGAFRPPTRTQDQLLPLSRLPRVNTESFTQPGFVDYSKRLNCSEGVYRQIKKDTIKACIRPTATYKINQQIREPFEVKYVIKNPVKFDSMAGFSGTRTRDLTIQDVKKPTRGLNDNILNTNAYSNKSGKTMINGEIDMNTNRYIQDVLYGDVQVNPSGKTMIDGKIDMNTDRYIQDVLYGDVQVNPSGKTMIDGEIDMNTDRYIQDVLYGDVQVNPSGKTMIDGEIDMNTDRYIQDVLYGDVQVNPSGKTMIDGEIDMSTDRYIQDVLYGDVQTNKSKSIHITPIDNVINTNNYTKDINNIFYTAPISGNTKDMYIHEDIELKRSSLLTSANSQKTQNIYVRPEVQYEKELQRNRPITEMVSNQGSNTMKSFNDMNNRDYKLHYTVNAGSYEGKAQRPLQNRITQYKEEYETEKSIRDKKIINMQQSRH